MKTTFFPVLSVICVLFTLSLFAADAPNLAAEKKKLDGTWVGGVKNGGGGPGKGKSKGPGGGGGGAYMVSITEFVIKDGKITAKGDRNSDFGAGTYTLNLGLAPKTLDATGTGGKFAGKSYLGIYRLNDDTLEWCMGNPGIERPKDFFTTPQVQFHMVLKRQPPVAAK